MSQIPHETISHKALKTIAEQGVCHVSVVSLEKQAICIDSSNGQSVTRLKMLGPCCCCFFTKDCDISSVFSKAWRHRQAPGPIFKMSLTRIPLWSVYFSQLQLALVVLCSLYCDAKQKNHPKTNLTIVGIVYDKDKSCVQNIYGLPALLSHFGDATTQLPSVHNPKLD